MFFTVFSHFIILGFALQTSASETKSNYNESSGKWARECRRNQRLEVSVKLKRMMENELHVLKNNPREALTTKAAAKVLLIKVFVLLM